MMRLEMFVSMQIEILDDQSSGLFSNQKFETRPVMTIEDFVVYSNDHFKSHLLGNGLYRARTCVCYFALLKQYCGIVIYGP